MPRSRAVVAKKRPGKRRACRSVSRIAKRQRKNVFTLFRNPYPKIRYTRHRYVTNFTLPAAGAAGFARAYYFACNDIYDPDYSGVGHQPMFRDEMSAYYKYYTVIKSDIKFSIDHSATAIQQLFCFVSSDSSVNMASPENLFEEQGGQWTVPTQPSLCIKAPNRRAYFNAIKFFKTNMKAILGDDEQRVAVAGSPGSKTKTYFVCGSAPINSGVTLGANYASAIIEFYVAWQDPIDAIGS